MHIPKGHKEAFEANFPKLAPKERMVFKLHTVKRGDTLSKIALTYHSFPEAIMQMNGLLSSKRLKLNTELMIPIAGEHAWTEAQKSEAAPKEHPLKVASRSSFVPARPEEEIPAGTPTKPVSTGALKHTVVNGKDELLYGVESGDSLWSISQKFGVTVEELKGWNDLSGKRPKLKIGQELTVYPKQLPSPPAAGAPIAAPKPAAPVQVAEMSMPPSEAKPVESPKPAAAPAADAVPDKVTTQGDRKHIVHTLVTGDTLWSLSQRYGVSVDALKKQNHLKRRALLHPGETLLVDVASGN